MTNNKTKGFILGAIAAASYGMNPPFHSSPLQCRNERRYSIIFTVIRWLLSFLAL